MELFSSIPLNDLLGVVIRTTIIFTYAFILLRLLGKRRLSHLSYSDLLLIIAFGSAVGDVMIYGESTVHLVTSMVAITVVAILVKILNEFSSRAPLSTVLDGSPRLLIDHGHIIKGELSKEDMSEEKLLSLLREKGVTSVSDVEKAHIEPDGEISVILRNDS